MILSQLFESLDQSRLDIGDDVIVRSPGLQFDGATGVIKNFGQDNRFVVVDLYNHGPHSFNISDVKANEYAGSDAEEAEMYDRGDFRSHPDDDVVENDDLSRQGFKSNELRHELKHEDEPTKFSVAIDGRVWKTFDDRRQAENIARSLRTKGKNATVVS